MYLWACGTFKSTEKLGSADRKSTNYKSANHKTDWVSKSQIRTVPHLQKVHKSYQLLKSTNLLICDLWNLFADSPRAKMVIVYSV